jgi:hypothetical protein
MSPLKLAMLGLLAIVALGAMTAGSASAATAQETRYFVEGTELTTEETVGGVAGVAQLNSTAAGSKIMIECTATEDGPVGENAAIESGGKSKGEIDFMQCYFYTISKGARTISGTCKVREPISVKVTDQLIAGAGGLVEDEFKPSSGSTFTEITIEKIPGKTCLLEKTYKVEGSYVASLGDEGERQMTEHELIFAPTGSKMTFEKEPASFTERMSRVKLKSGKTYF